MSYTLKIAREDPKGKEILKRVQQYIKWAEQAQTTQHDEWLRAEESMLAYIPASEADNRRELEWDDEGTPNYRTIVMPYSYAVALSAHTYLTSVFFARDPVLQFTGRHGETQQNIQAVEATVDYQTKIGGHLVPYYSWLYDKVRYGFGVVGLHWDKEIHHVATIEVVDEAVSATEAELLFGEASEGKRREVVVREVEAYEGNKMYNVSPWNFLPDPRVPLQQFQSGQFIAVRCRIGWDYVKRREAQGYYINVDMIKTAHGTGSRANFGTSVVQKPEDTAFLENNDDGHPGIVHTYEVYVSLIPSEWKLGKRDYPEKWVFTVTQDCSLLLGATPLDSYHCKYPFSIVKLDPDAYTNFSRGYPKIMKPIQDTMSWLLNSHFYNVRAALQNLFVVDPSKVNLTDLEDPLYAGVIRVNESYYGQDVRMAVHQIPINDVTQGHFPAMNFMQGIGEIVGGVNDQVMGALASGGRRTATEVRSSTSFSVNRLKTSAEFNSAMGFDPLSQMILQNTQQYFSMEKKYRIAGSLMQDAGGFVQVDARAIAGCYDYVPVDGTLPIDRLAQGKMWQELFMTMRQFPQLAIQYDLGRMFAWVASLVGMKNINQFKIDLQDPEAIQRQVLLGNLVAQPNDTKGPASALRGNSNGAGGPVL